MSLRRLEKFMINDLYGCNLGELNALNNLQGSFKIYELVLKHDVINNLIIIYLNYINN